MNTRPCSYCDSDIPESKGQFCSSQCSIRYFLLQSELGLVAKPVTRTTWRKMQEAFDDE